MILIRAIVLKSREYLGVEHNNCRYLLILLSMFLTIGRRVICNTSGSGKTRRMLEGLTKYWGFYIVAALDDNGVGVRDLPDALDEIAQYKEWQTDLKSLPLEDRANQDDCNSVIASRQLLKVLAARIAVFELFLEVAIQVDGWLLEKHKRIWLLFQLSDELMSYTTHHPFVRIIRNCLHNASDDALQALVNRLDDIRFKYMSRSHFIFGLDELQRATRSYPNAFVSSSTPTQFRSIVREIAKVFNRSAVKLVVSGTGLSVEDLREAIAPGVSKPTESIVLFHDLGMFDTWPKLKAFLDRYIPASVLESDSGLHLQKRIREYLLGR